MIKTCVLCGKQFETVRYGEARKYCFECSPSYKEKGGQHISVLRRHMKKSLVDYKGGKCEICGYNKCIDALEFHHLNPNEKEFTIAQYCASNHSDYDKAKAEVDKCILVCANCHREIHANERADSSVGRAQD